MKQLRAGLKIFSGLGGMLGISALLFVPFLLLFFYTRMTVDTAILRRKIQSASAQRDELARKNRSLRRALFLDMAIDPEAANSMLVQNRIVRVRLPENLTTDQGEGNSGRARVR